VFVFLPSNWQVGRIEPFIGSLDETIRLTALFLTGVSFFLFRQQIAYRSSYAALAAIGLVALLFHSQIAGPAVAVLGGYLVFWFAFLPETPILNAINSKTDLSYGVYLYAWPIQMLLIRYLHGVTPGAVMVLTAIGAALLAFASWTVIEKPALYYKRAFRRTP
jgi:peptidoglycan/LPS O-acetylase OafA/YrhL